MLDFRIPILFGMLLLVSVQYLLEVHIGTSSNMYDAESGFFSRDCMPRKSPSAQFIGKFVPLQLAAVGFPLLARDLVLGGLLIFVSLLLLGLHKRRSGHCQGETR